tara:strand:- start:1989 stop:2633 length:645 start_codon:yes stop_codon:yes gene_type:complete
MDEELSIIDSKTRNEKIKNFFVQNKRIIILSITILILIILSFYSYQIYQDKHKQRISEKFNNAVIDFEKGNSSISTQALIEVIEDRNITYSPLALYFIIDNNLIQKQTEVNELFDILINKTSLENEIKYLIIYKKALYNGNTIEENDLLQILKPLINSESIWKSHGLYLLAEYFFSKNEKQKAKDFFSQIISLENANQEILRESQKRLNRDLSD